MVTPCCLNHLTHFIFYNTKAANITYVPLSPTLGGHRCRGSHFNAKKWKNPNKDPFTFIDLCDILLSLQCFSYEQDVSVNTGENMSCNKRCAFNLTSLTQLKTIVELFNMLHNLLLRVKTFLASWANCVQLFSKSQTTVFSEIGVGGVCVWKKTALWI